MRRSVSSPEKVRGIARRKPAVSEVCFREKFLPLQVVEESSGQLVSTVASRLRWPNKSVQPTRGSVTSRADRSFEFKSLGKARLAPAPRAADL